MERRYVVRHRKMKGKSVEGKYDEEILYAYLQFSNFIYIYISK